MKPGSSINSRPTTAKKNFSQTNKLIKAVKKLTLTTNPQNQKKQQKTKRSEPQEYIQSQQLYQTIEQLIAKQKQFEKTGKYVEAQACKRKVLALKQTLQKQQVQQIRSRHKGELVQIQEAHLEQMNCFALEWDKIISDLNAQIQQLEQQIMKKHEDQIKMIEEQISQQKPKNFHQSPQLLNLRKIQQQLAKQENYMEAHQVQLKAQKLQKQEIQKWKKNQLSKGKNNLNTLRIRQQSQLSAFRQKIQLNIQQKQRQKKQEQQKLILKYENVIKELQYQQNQELARYQKNIKLSQYHKKTKGLGNFASQSKASLM